MMIFFAKMMVFFAELGAFLDECLFKIVVNRNNVVFYL